MGTRKIMTIFSEKSLSGRKIMSLGNELKIVLDNLIGSKMLMTEKTFELIYDYLVQIGNNRIKATLLATNAPELAWQLHRVPIDNLERVIANEGIDGSKFIEL